MAYLNQSAGAAREGVQAVAVANVGTLTGAAAAGANPTKAEHDAVVADLATLKNKLNALLTSMRTAGQLAP